MARGAPLGVVDDTSPLNGPTIEAARRAAWTVRMARVGVPREARSPSLDEVAAAAAVSPSRLHRLETGQLREGRLVDAYERALERPTGSLRAPVDILYRTFPSMSPPDRDPGPWGLDVRTMSAATERVGDDRVTGGEWLTWARALAAPGNVALPEGLAGELVGRLARELSRSVGAAFSSRYEALALLRCSAYGHLVLAVVRDHAKDPHVQVLFDLMSVVGERASDDALDWCLELLEQGRPALVVGAALAMENMAAVTSDRDVWAPVARPLIALLDASEPGTDRWEWLSHLVRLMPRSTVRRAGVKPSRALAPLAHTRSWERSRRNAGWRDCEDRALAITDALDLPAQPMLARLLFDMVHSPFETRAVTGSFLLGALPWLGQLAGEQLIGLVDSTADPVLRGRAVRRLPAVLGGHLPPAVERWLGEPSHDGHTVAFRVAGDAGVRLPEALLQAAVRDTARRSAALYSAGMSGHPVLGSWGRSPDPELRGGARWWAQHGPRLVDAED
jgi:hypothetical protein